MARGPADARRRRSCRRGKPRHALCPGPRSILLCALAEEIGGNHEAANALLERAEELKMEGHGLVREGRACASS